MDNYDTKLYHVDGERISNFYKIAVALFIVVVYVVADGYFLCYGLTTYLWIAYIITWSIMIHNKILNIRIRRYLIAATFFMCLIFLIRIIKFDMDFDNRYNEIQWYMFYVPILALSFLSLMISLCVDKVKEDVPKNILAILTVVFIVLCIFVLTNSYHHQVFSEIPPFNIYEKYNREWGFFLIFACEFLLVISAYIVLFVKCRLSLCRKYSWIPIVVTLVFFALLIWYFLSGGRPTIFGKKIFNMQEIYCLLFIMFWDSCIYIGLIPSNSGYAEIFNKSGVNAVIYDKNGKPVYVGESAEITNNIPADNESIMYNDCIRISGYNVVGGRICYEENMQNLYALQEELKESTQRLEEENTLIDEENKVKKLNEEYRVKSRIYDKIAVRLHPTLSKIINLLDDDDDDKSISEADILSAFVKRCANLLLISEKKANMKTMELYLSIRESMEYMNLSGITCDVIINEDCEMPSEVAIIIYEIFERIVEKADVNTMFVVIDKYTITIQSNKYVDGVVTENDIRYIESKGFVLTSNYEDDIWYVKMVPGGDV